MSGATLVWLDALAGELCTPEAFVTAMREHFHGDPDDGWEVLSLLDQYYRRGKIKPEVFHSVKSQLEGSALNPDDDAMAEAPAPAAAPPPARTRAPAPAPTPVPARASAPSAIPVPAAAPAFASVSRSAETAAQDPRPAIREAAVGDTLRKRYKLRAVLGRGGLSTIFEGIDEYRLDMPKVGQRLAIKVLHTAVSKRRELLTELQMEFQHLQSLSHPNIIRVHEFDRDGDIAFFTMEYLGGAPLGRVLAARNSVAVPRPEALAMVRDIGAALSHAHSRSVVHGNLNPQNIFITNDGELRVLDFGNSRTLIPTLLPADGELPQTAPLAVRPYASCEMLEGQRPDRRDDVFAFACIAYELLSGQHPFPQRTAIDARARGVRPPRPPGLTGEQWQVLREGLSWDRERRPADIQPWLQRFGTAGAASRLPSLPALVNLAAPRKYRLGPAVAAVVVIALLAGAAYWAVVNYDSLSHSVAAWTNHPQSLPAGDQAPVAATPPDTSTAPVPPTAPAAATPPPAMKPAAPPVVTRTAPAASAHVKAAPVARPLAVDPTPRTAGAGPARIELAADTVDVQAGDTAAHVIVGRRGNLHGDASFTWWTESGTAKPGLDFSAVPPREGHIADGSGSVSLSIPISGAPRSQPKSFYVVIDRSDSGAAVVGRTLTMVTLQPPG